MGRDIAVPIIQEGSPVFEELFNSVKDVDKGTCMVPNYSLKFMLM